MRACVKAIKVDVHLRPESLVVATRLHPSRGLKPTNDEISGDACRTRDSKAVFDD